MPKTTKEIMTLNISHSLAEEKINDDIVKKNELWFSQSEMKVWLESQRQEPNDMFTIERLIDRFDELSQSSRDTNSNSVRPDKTKDTALDGQLRQDKCSNPDTSITSQSNGRLSGQDTSKTDVFDSAQKHKVSDTLIHFHTRNNSMYWHNLCNNKSELSKGTIKWSLVTCPDCLRLRGLKVEEIPDWRKDTDRVLKG